MTTYRTGLGALTTRGQVAGWSAVLSRAAALLIRRKNRRAMLSLRELNEHQLADIGVTRDDLRSALRGGPLTDHSGELMCAVKRRRQRSVRCLPQASSARETDR
ncbi:DUF1127 domain-containing protein [Hoeflea sp. TYP-13]|uniref:DUF1127 domain-containing protein n=1 Tax=Hoeflea sp. TYP-13 TaxID=3230023 RepID=UPI0034C66E2C